jgi:hypothetical protein
MDWHLFWTAAGVVLTLSAVIIGCYVSINTRLTRIETIMFMQGHIPKEMIAAVEEK